MVDLQRHSTLPALPVAASGRHIIDSRGRTVADCPEPSTAAFLALAINLGQAGKVELPPTPAPSYRGNFYAGPPLPRIVDRPRRDPDAHPRGLPSRVLPEQIEDGRCRDCGAALNCLHALDCNRR